MQIKIQHKMILLSTSCFPALRIISESITIDTIGSSIMIINTGLGLLPKYPPAIQCDTNIGGRYVKWQRYWNRSKRGLLLLTLLKSWYTSPSDIKMALKCNKIMVDLKSRFMIKSGPAPNEGHIFFWLDLKSAASLSDIAPTSDLSREELPNRLLLRKRA